MIVKTMRRFYSALMITEIQTSSRTLYDSPETGSSMKNASLSHARGLYTWTYSEESIASVVGHLG